MVRAKARKLQLQHAAFVINELSPISWVFLVLSRYCYYSSISNTSATHSSFKGSTSFRLSRSKFHLRTFTILLEKQQQQVILWGPDIAGARKSQSCQGREMHLKASKLFDKDFPQPQWERNPNLPMYPASPNSLQPEASHAKCFKQKNCATLGQPLHKIEKLKTQPLDDDIVKKCQMGNGKVKYTKDWKLTETTPCWHMNGRIAVAWLCWWLVCLLN